ncbi:DarT ssDNA thymidine ADP-ribosyltransferase family protein [Acholeplasma vituli]|uniref:DarT ssDNA thymidine ADP-ribosyltransferase family protein n=1 Tax=Paracholeplasma vituli TaxID=69473 RepID=A0ABT2PVX5_9MOLU|nr:DarT ssDNA thymidine ADP-ribosyltransferase family protein [Paracholeplasma vituli]MCU0105116.1 DarT ssDNA thymidine ADP-ribosyltransferase family protein [Paracholeplasma vituli]
MNNIDQLIHNYYQYPNFIGFVHCTEMSNFLNICKSGVILSRTASKRIIDSANQNQIMATSASHPEIMNCTRFYLAPKTPTYYQMNFRNPVILLVSPDILYSRLGRVFFVNKQINSSRVIVSANIDIALDFNYDKIFDRTPKRGKSSLYQGIVINVYINIRGLQEIEFCYEDQTFFTTNFTDISFNIGDEVYFIFNEYNTPYIVNHDDTKFRNAEVAFMDPISISEISSIIFQCDDDLQFALEKITDEHIKHKFIIDPSVFFDYRF